MPKSKPSVPRDDVPRGTSRINLTQNEMTEFHDAVVELKKENTRLKKENTRLKNQDKERRDEWVEAMMENARLRSENKELKFRFLNNNHAGTTQRQNSDDLQRKLKILISKFHPDKWNGHSLAHEITVELVDLREELGNVA